jgi:hypothetical protein
VASAVHAAHLLLAAASKPEPPNLGSIVAGVQEEVLRWVEGIDSQ